MEMKSSSDKLEILFNSLVQTMQNNSAKNENMKIKTNKTNKIMDDDTRVSSFIVISEHNIRGAVKKKLLSI